ncbi:MAG: conjugal transfer protein TraG, partial [Rhodomicrobium sp.]
MSPLGPPEPKVQSRTLLILLPLGLLALNAAATQYIAAKFAYHPALGAPLLGHFYLPWEWLVWQQKYASYAPHLFRTSAAALAAALSLSLLALLAMNGRSAKRHEGIHGTAHWASRPEIEATGLLPAKGRKAQGVYVGGWRD